MNQQELVETVIREVKRVLALRGVDVAPVSGAAQAVSPARDASPQVVKGASAESAAPASGIDLTGKQVIVLKDIQTLAGGTVRIASKAVITPMAVDYAREKGITLVRVDSAEKKESGMPVPVTAAGMAVCPDFPGNRGLLTSFLTGKGFQVREFTGQSYEASVKALCGAVSSGAVHFGVCLEHSGMMGVIHANRSQSVRAVHCRDLYDARAARVDIGANVIVLDSRSNPEEIISGFTGMK